MKPERGEMYAVFGGDRLIAAGSLTAALTAAKVWLDGEEDGRVLIFEDSTGRQMDFDFRGTIDEVLARALAPQQAGRGRPRLGVQSREVSLLPKHWEWLQSQPNGISATLRSLIEAEMNEGSPLNTAHRARDAAYKFITVMAGDRAGYEEACRALYRADRRRFQSETTTWPAAVKTHARRLAALWFEIKS
jgi:hypothetical protein